MCAGSGFDALSLLLSFQFSELRPRCCPAWDVGCCQLSARDCSRSQWNHTSGCVVRVLARTLFVGRSSAGERGFWRAVLGLRTDGFSFFFEWACPCASFRSTLFCVVKLSKAAALNALRHHHRPVVWAPVGAPSLPQYSLTRWCQRRNSRLASVFEAVQRGARAVDFLIQVPGRSCLVSVSFHMSHAH